MGSPGAARGAAWRSCASRARSRWCGRAPAAASSTAGRAPTSRSARSPAAAGLPASTTSFAFAHAARELGVDPGRGRRDLPGRRRRAVRRVPARRPASRWSVTRARGIITAAEVGTWGRDEVLALARDGGPPGRRGPAAPGHGPAHRGPHPDPGEGTRQAGPHGEPGDGLGGPAAGGPEGERPGAGSLFTESRSCRCARRARGLRGPLTCGTPRRPIRDAGTADAAPPNRPGGRRGAAPEDGTGRGGGGGNNRSHPPVTHRRQRRPHEPPQEAPP